jgi:hypothetical protein
MLIGSSIVKDIDQTKLANTIVKCLPGAKVVNLTGEIEKLPGNSYDRLVIVGGGNNCSDTKDSNAIVSDFKVMINAAKRKANTVTVASVCPRGISEVQENIDTVNAGLQSLCSDLSCTYADTNEFLKLSDGTLNEGYYRDDHIHLTLKGQNKLATKLELISCGNETPLNVTTVRANQEKTSRGKPPTTNPTSQMTRTGSSNTSSYMSTSQDQGMSHARTPQRVNTSKSRCAYCAEPHHDTDRCRHQRPVQCYSLARMDINTNIVTQKIVIDGRAKKSVPLAKIIFLMTVLIPMLMILLSNYKKLLVFIVRM